MADDVVGGYFYVYLMYHVMYSSPPISIDPTRDTRCRARYRLRYRIHERGNMYLSWYLTWYLSWYLSWCMLTHHRGAEILEFGLMSTLTL